MKCPCCGKKVKKLPTVLPDRMDIHLDKMRVQFILLKKHSVINDCIDRQYGVYEDYYVATGENLWAVCLHIPGEKPTLGWSEHEIRYMNTDGKYRYYHNGWNGAPSGHIDFKWFTQHEVLEMFPEIWKLYPGDYE